MDVEERKKNYEQTLDAAASYVCDHICTKLQGVPEEEAEEICTACGTGKHIENLLNAYDEMAAAYKDAEEKQNKSVVKRIQEFEKIENIGLKS